MTTKDRTDLLPKYREYNPYTEAIIEVDSDFLIVIDRYDVNDYGVWWTDEEHLYDETFGSSCRGSLDGILYELRDIYGKENEK